jgi:hypothetical protein
MAGATSKRIGKVDAALGVSARRVGSRCQSDRGLYEQLPLFEAARDEKSLIPSHISPNFACFLGRAKKISVRASWGVRDRACLPGNARRSAGERRPSGSRIRAPKLRRWSEASRLNGALLAVVCSRQDSPRRLAFAIQTGSQARANRHEAELNVLGVFAVCVSVTIVPILWSLGYSSTATRHEGRDYLRKRELLSDELVDAASTIQGRQAQLMPCTILFCLSKTLISPDFGSFRLEWALELCRSNLEQFREFVKHWSAKMIRPEEETIHAGEPT